MEKKDFEDRRTAWEQEEADKRDKRKAKRQKKKEKSSEIKKKVKADKKKPFANDGSFMETFLKQQVWCTSFFPFN
jgi:hypothetical protein